MTAKIGLFFFMACALPGCAGLRFAEGYDAGGLTFFDPTPHLLVKVAADCAIASEVVSLPGKQRSLRMKAGYGSAALSVTLANGMIASVGQTTDTKVPETITALSGAVAAVAGIGFERADNGAASPCVPRASLFAIRDGRVDHEKDLLEFRAR